MKWEVHDGGRFGRYGDMGPSICLVKKNATCQPLFEVVGPADAERCKAYAHLAAAAPELLGFIKEMLADSRSETDHHGVTTFDEDRAVELIAKAEGKK